MQKMKSLILSITAVLSAPVFCPASHAQSVHSVLVGMTDRAHGEHALAGTSSSTDVDVSQITYSGRPLSAHYFVPSPVRKLDFHRAQASRQLGGREFDWTAGNARK